MKTHATTHFLRLVERDQQPERPNSHKSDLNLEADKIAALNGSNLYSGFLREHGHRPDREQAATIGRLMGARVRASDGTMQPKLTAGESAAIRSIKKRRREWAQQVDHVQRTIAAITALSENHHEPSAVFNYGSDVFLSAEIREKLDSALSWLKRFAEDSYRYDKENSCSKSPQLLGRDHKRVAKRRFADGSDNS